ncbi:hypothetical protein pipiens_000373, partial [Culex pipiens pipiens]
SRRRVFRKKEESTNSDQRSPTPRNRPHPKNSPAWVVFFFREEDECLK